MAEKQRKHPEKGLVRQLSHFSTEEIKGATEVSAGTGAKELLGQGWAHRKLLQWERNLHR